MKFVSAFIFALCVSLEIMAGKVIKNPDIEFYASWMTINEIELTKDATIVRGNLMRGCSIINNTVLRDRQTGKEYKFLRVEGIKAYEQASADNTPCTVYFEPLDADVKEINYIEVGNNPFGNFYGIRLQSKAKNSKKTKGVNYESYNYDYYMNQPFTPDTAWHFSNKPYKESLYAARKKDFLAGGSTQVKIHLNGLPKELASMAPNINVKTENQILRKDVNTLATLNEDMCYVVDLNLAYPQHVLVNPLGTIFVMPGDTLDVYTTLESKPGERKPRFMTFRSKGESAIINTLLPVLMEKYGKEKLNYSELRDKVAQGKDVIQPIAERMANQVNEILDDSEFRQALIHSPLSTFGKDVVMASTLANTCIYVIDVLDQYEYTKVNSKQNDDGTWHSEKNPNYVPLDLKPIFGTILKNKELIFDNPVFLCERSQWVFVNRTLYCDLLRKYEHVYENGTIIESYQTDDYDMNGTFMKDLSFAQNATFTLDNNLKNIKLGKTYGLSKEEISLMVANDIGKNVAGIQSPMVAKAVLNEYRNFVKATESSEQSESNGWSESDNALWNKIVGPYKGNLLFLDFWGMGCGPCRAGMISQKSLVEQLKDEAIKFLYITEDSQKQDAERWMGEKEIKGEHIYITGDEWKQFESMINFNAIPRTVLVGKDGKLIERDFEYRNFSANEFKELINKF